MTRAEINRYVWAAKVAEIAMGKVKKFGGKPISAAQLDPLAWWCLAEVIATGGPKLK